MFVIVLMLLLGWFCCDYWSSMYPLAVVLGWICKLGLVGIALGGIYDWRQNRKMKKAEEGKKQKQQEEKERYLEHLRLEEERLKQTPGALFSKRLLEQNPNRKPFKYYTGESDDQPYHCPICGKPSVGDLGEINSGLQKPGGTEKILCRFCLEEFRKTPKSSGDRLPRGIKYLSPNLWIAQMEIASDYHDGLIDKATRDEELEIAAELERKRIQAREDRLREEAEAKRQYEQQERDRISSISDSLRK